MITRHGVLRRASSLLAVACALSCASRRAEAQVPANARPLVIIPMLSESDLLASPPPHILIEEGHALYDAGRYKEAAASFERAMQAGVARPHEAAWNVARSYAKFGNRKQALRWVEIAQLLERNPEGLKRSLQNPLLLKL